MHYLIILIFAALATATPVDRTQHLLPRANRVDYPGPIPYLNPKHGFPNQEDVTSNNKHFGLATSQDDMKACLVAYGSDRFYDSWSGNICGSMGWFKGSKNDDMDPYDCYQTCATYVEGEGILNDVKDYQCDFERGVHGHCWMGYHPVDPASIPVSNGSSSTGNRTRLVETAQ
ncbi:hypothetical protein ACLMJK_000653 [Lecanora helva]